MPTAPTTQRRTLLVVGGLVAVAAIALGVVALAGDEDDDPASGSSTTSTTAATTSSTEPAPTSSTLPLDPAEAAIAAYPDLEGGSRFEDPLPLVEAFATQLLGFDTDLVIGELQQGDARSGEVVVRPRLGGPETVIPVRQVADGSWVVLGASTELIQLSEPLPGAALARPQRLSGLASAFEGHVDVALYADGTAAPIATTFVIGSGDGTPGPFEGELAAEPPDGAAYGVLVLTAGGGEDGTTQYALAIRVAF